MAHSQTLGDVGERVEGSGTEFRERLVEGPDLGIDVRYEWWWFTIRVDEDLGWHC